MKAVIVAAGSGTRFKPFSLTEAKILTMFLGKALIMHHIDEFIDNGVRDFIIVCNNDNIKDIEKLLLRKYKASASFIFVIQSEQLGPAHAIYCGKDFFVNEEYIIYKYADSTSDTEQVRPLLECFEKGGHDGAITLRKVDDPSRYGIARLKGNCIVELVEKPKKNPPSNLAVVGMGILDVKRFIMGIEKDKLEKGKVEVAPIEYVLREKGSVDYWVYKGKRGDLGKPWDVLLTNKLMIEKNGGRILLKNTKNADISSNSFIGKNAVIGKNVIIKGFSSVEGKIGDNTVIEDSVIMENTVIGNNCVIKNSVIGKNNKIGNNFKTKTGKAKVFVKNNYEDTPLPSVGVFTGENVVIKDKISSNPGKIVYPNKKINTDIKEDRIIRAMLFDADNTLYNTRDVGKQADMEAMKMFSKAIKGEKSAEQLYDVWRNMLGPKILKSNDPRIRHRTYSYGILAKQIGIKDKDIVNKAYSAAVKKLGSTIKQKPGLKKVLPILRKFKCAIITESSMDLTDPKIKGTKLDKVFDTVITSDDIGITKPSKLYYEVALDKLDVEAQECIVIGDDFDKDLKIGGEMGMITVYFGEKTEKRADYSIKNYDNFAQLVGKL